MGIHNDCSWNDVILMMMRREVIYTELRIIYLPSCTFLSQTLKTSSAQDGCLSISSNALTTYLKTKLLKLILKKKWKGSARVRWTSWHWQVCMLKTYSLHPALHPQSLLLKSRKLSRDCQTQRDWHEMLVKRKGKNEWKRNGTWERKVDSLSGARITLLGLWMDPIYSIRCSFTGRVLSFPPKIPSPCTCVDQESAF